MVFLLLPPVLMHLFRDYGRFVNPGIHVIWFLLMIVGLSSAYFHATLSLIGENCDLVLIYDNNKRITRFFLIKSLFKNSLFMCLIRLSAFYNNLIRNRTTARRINYSVGVHGSHLYVLSKKIFSKYFSQQQEALFHMHNVTDSDRHGPVSDISSHECFRIDESGYTGICIHDHGTKEVIPR